MKWATTTQKEHWQTLSNPFQTQTLALFSLKRKHVEMSHHDKDAHRNIFFVKIIEIEIIEIEIIIEIIEGEMKKKHNSQL